MTNDPNRVIEQLGIFLPSRPAPAANYAPTKRVGDLLFVSGQLPLVEDGTLLTGTLGRDADIEQGVRAARACALNILSQVEGALGNLDRVASIVKLTGFVSSTPDFFDQSKVVNGASDLFCEIFGASGVHARAAVGVSALPLNSSVEVEAIIEVKKI